jgi:hypothetical protein
MRLVSFAAVAVGSMAMIASAQPAEKCRDCSPGAYNPVVQGAEGKVFDGSGGFRFTIGALAQEERRGRESPGISRWTTMPPPVPMPAGNMPILKGTAEGAAADSPMPVEWSRLTAGALPAGVTPGSYARFSSLRLLGDQAASKVGFAPPRPCAAYSLDRDLRANLPPACPPKTGHGSMKSSR